jgi:hypothetical protein
VRAPEHAGGLGTEVALNDGQIAFLIPCRLMGETGTLVDMTDSTGQPPDEPSEQTTFEKTLARWAAIIGVIAAIIGVFAEVWTWSALSTNLAKAFSLAGILLLPLVLARLYKSLKGKRLTWGTAWDLASVGALCVFATVIVVNLTGNSLPSLRFVQATALHECQNYYGTGTIPEPKYTLLIFDSPTSNGPYYLDGEAANQPQGGWQSPLVMTGNDPTWISAVLMPSSSANFVDKIFLTSIKPKFEAELGSLGLAWLSPVLPPGQESIPPLKVQSPLDGSGCPS